MMAAKVRRHGRIQDELPVEIREQVDRLIVEGGCTYDDIKAFLDEAGYDISRSAIGRYGKEFLDSYRRLRVIEDKSRALISEVGDGLVLEEATSKILMQRALECLLDGDLDAKESASLMKGVAQLQSSSVQREKLKKELRGKVEQTAGEIAAAARSGGLSEDLIRQIEEQVLGIVR
jgi:hypothetical protein